MREAAELAWQRPSGLGVGGGTRAGGMWARARARKWLALPWGTCHMKSLPETPRMTQGICRH